MHFSHQTNVDCIGEDKKPHNLNQIGYKLQMKNEIN